VAAAVEKEKSREKKGRQASEVVEETEEG